MSGKPRKVAVAGVDPGGTSGLFCGIVTLDSSMRRTCAPGLEALVVEQVDGNFRRQARELADRCQNWFSLAHMERGVALVDLRLEIEDWDTGRRQPGRELVSVWIAAAFDALMTTGPSMKRTRPFSPFDGGEYVTYNSAAQAKGYATNARLKTWRLDQLTRGTPHARDASRHWALGVNRMIR